MKNTKEDELARTVELALLSGVVATEVSAITKLLVARVPLVGGEGDPGGCPACGAASSFVLRPAAFAVRATDVQLVGCHCNECKAQFVYVVPPRDWSA